MRRNEALRTPPSLRRHPILSQQTDSTSPLHFDEDLPTTANPPISCIAANGYVRCYVSLWNTETVSSVTTLTCSAIVSDAVVGGAC